MTVQEIMQRIKDIKGGYVNGDINSEEMVEAINSSPEKIKQMSEACIEWFEENCSVDGSFKTTMEIIND